jgi:thiol reductant ABC exporter CydC subunit
MRVLGRLLRFLIPSAPALALATLLGVLMVASNMGLLGLAAYLVAAAALKPLLTALSVPIYLVRLFSLTRAGARYAERLTSHALTFRLLARLRTWFYGRLEPLAPLRLGQYRSGDLLARIVKDVDDLENLYLRGVAPLAVAFLVAALTTAFFALISPLLALATLACLLVGGAGVPALVAVLARRWHRRELELRAALQATLVDGVQGVVDLVACGAEADYLQKVAGLNGALGGVQGRLAVLTGVQDSTSDLVAQGTVLVVLAMAIPLVSAGRVGGASLAAMALVALASFEALRPVGQAFAALGRTLAAGGRLFAIVDSPPAVTEPPHPLVVPPSPALEFRHVCFAYAPDEPAVLHDVTLQIAPGRRVAVVGPSGAGKSTLVALAARFADPSGGALLLAGQPLAAYASDAVRDAVGVTGQDAHIFQRSVRANLLLARPAASEDDLWWALEQAQLASVVRRLPEGLDSQVGAQGQALSGGERQRLAVARVLLKDAPLVILDEPTAHLDPDTERRLLDALWAALAGRGVLLITHRLVCMDAMDEILVLDAGHVVERGTHAQLLAAGGLYRQMYDVQRGVLGTRPTQEEGDGHG